MKIGFSKLTLQLGQIECHGDLYYINLKEN